MKKIIGWLIAIAACVPILPIVFAVGIVKKLRTGEVTMQELVAKYYLDVFLSVGVVAICAIVCWRINRRQRPGPVKQRHVVELQYKDKKEERILRWAEEGEGREIVELADGVSRERLEMPGPQDTPSPVFESTRAFFERLAERLRRR